MTLESVLNFLNLIISSANLLLAFSLVVYVFLHNLWSSVARTFAALMGFVSIVYASDIMLSSGSLDGLSQIAWLRFQWIGIAFVPAVYLHLSDALLRTTNAYSQRRRMVMAFSYVIGLGIAVLALFTDTIIKNEVNYEPWAPQLAPGPGFWGFVFYFFLTSGWGFANTLWARSRTLTHTSRRRMTYLVASFAAPGLAVYPYLILASVPFPTAIVSWVVLALNLLGNIGVAVLTTVMAYSVATQGSISPDRVVKRSFLTFILRGPALGLFILLIILVVPRVESIFGAPRETFLIFTIVGGIIFYQVLQKLLRPVVDYLAYRDDREEVALLRSLDDRLITTGDLQQLLENLLTAVCDLLRARNGAVVSLIGQNGSGVLMTESEAGDRDAVRGIINNLNIAALLQPASVTYAVRPPENGLRGTPYGFRASPDLPDDISTWQLSNSYRILPLRADDGESVLGFLIVEPGREMQPLSDREKRLLRQYVQQAELALQDRRLQENVYGLLRQLTPQMETLQRWRADSPVPQENTEQPEGATTPITDDSFNQWVRDALTHYWGGPRLTESPLLTLNVVRARLAEHDNNPAKALRAVLGEALEMIKPETERDMTTPGWLLYNILDLKYVQGRRARDVANRLAMSESDLYRKQRAAIEELAKAVGQMEETIGSQNPPR